MSEAIAVKDIDGNFVPRPRREILDIEVGAERVLLGSSPYALNGTAALVWQCFDGEISLDELIADLTAATGVDEVTIRSDVVALTRELAAFGMLEGVEPNGTSAVDSTERSVEVGGALETFVFPDLDGNETSWDSFRGRRVLLVNWSPGCGFCTRIADELADLQRPLDERGISLVFLTRGGADANRARFEKHGIRSLALLGSSGGPFAGFGTPAAYLVDDAGNVAAPFAYGAFAVPQLAREAAGLDDEASPSGPSPGTRYLPAEAAVCGSGQGDGTAWAGTAAYRFGEFHVGIRHNADNCAKALDDLFPGLRVDDARTPDNYSVVLEEPRGRTRQFNVLLHGSRYLIRSRSRARILQGLVSHLSGELNPPEQPLLGLRASAAAVHAGRATLLPTTVFSWMSLVQPRLDRLGIQLTYDLPWTAIDPVTAEIVVPEPAVDYDPRLIDSFEGVDPLGAELPAIAPGRYPLGAWILPARDVEGTLSPGRALVEVLPLLMVPRESIEQAAATLVKLFEKVEPVGAWLDRPATLTEFLQQLN